MSTIEERKAALLEAAKAVITGMVLPSLGNTIDMLADKGFPIPEPDQLTGDKAYYAATIAAGHMTCASATMSESCEDSTTFERLHNSVAVIFMEASLDALNKRG